MSLVGFKARNHPQQPVRDEVNDRRTPAEFFNALHAEHHFTLDAAANAENAKISHNYRSVDNCGLAASWTGERVWCNPPYTGLDAWVAKAWREMWSGCDLVVMLLPNNRCEQPWWQDNIEPFRDGPAVDGVQLRTTFLEGRLRFGMPASVRTPKGGWRPPFGCVLVTWSHDTRALGAR